jgi:hypothetical protein
MVLSSSTFFFFFQTGSPQLRYCLENWSVSSDEGEYGKVTLGLMGDQQQKGLSYGLQITGTWAIAGLLLFSLNSFCLN